MRKQWFIKDEWIIVRRSSGKVSGYKLTEKRKRMIEKKEKSETTRGYILIKMK